MKYVENKVNVTLISARRLGKTGLMMRFADELKKEQSAIFPIYIDISSTTSLVELVRKMAESVYRIIPEKNNISKKFLSFLRSIHASVSFDEYTAYPQINIAYRNEPEKETTLSALLTFLDTLDIPVCLMIDEFQQICKYEEKNVEALLRSQMQFLHNVRFVFSGSKRSLMAEMFGNAKRPFFSSTSTIALGKISEEAYCEFILRMFNQGGKQINNDAIQYILWWTCRHTYYTQELCQTIWNEESSNIDVVQVKHACDLILKAKSAQYLQYKEFLTELQWQYLIAFAKEGEVTEPQGKTFMKKYGMTNNSSSKRTLLSLVQKELILAEPTKQKTVYMIYDVFFRRWLEREY